MHSCRGPLSEFQPLSLTREQLIMEQRNDATPSPLFEAVIAGEQVDSESTAIFDNA